MLVRPAAADRQHFLLRRTRQDLAHEVQDKADAEIDRDPSFQGAPTQNPSHLPVGKTFDHVRGRQDHETDILVGIDRRRPPSRSADGSCGSRTGNVIPKRERLFASRVAFRNDPGEARVPTTSGSMMFPSAAAAIRRVERGRDGDGVAVHPESEGGDDRKL